MDEEELLETHFSPAVFLPTDDSNLLQILFNNLMQAVLEVAAIVAAVGVRALRRTVFYPFGEAVRTHARLAFFTLPSVCKEPRTYLA